LLILNVLLLEGNVFNSALNGDLLSDSFADSTSNGAYCIVGSVVSNSSGDWALLVNLLLVVGRLLDVGWLLSVSGGSSDDGSVVRGGWVMIY